jgi:hypothetical protein
VAQVVKHFPRNSIRAKKKRKRKQIGLVFIVDVGISTSEFILAKDISTCVSLFKLAKF